MSYLTSAEIKAEVLSSIAPAAKYNTTIRPNSQGVGTRYMERSGEGTLVAALYCELDNRFTLLEVEAALTYLTRERAIRVLPESAQFDLTSYDNEFAFAFGGQLNHWIEIA